MEPWLVRIYKEAIRTLILIPIQIRTPIHTRTPIRTRHTPIPIQIPIQIARGSERPKTSRASNFLNHGADS